MLSIDEREMVRDLLNNVAGDDYEGWEGYWDEQAKWAAVIEKMLELWQQFAYWRKAGEQANA